MTMNMSWKINMLLEIETCEYLIEFVGVLHLSYLDVN